MTKIENIIHYTEFKKDGRRIPMKEIHYSSGKKHEGIIYLEEEGLTKELLLAAVKKAAALPDSVIGLEF